MTTLPPTEGVLSSLTEAGIYGRDLTLLGAQDATLILADEAGRITEYTDLVVAYGAVNFGHRNPSILPFATAPADIAACFFPPEAATVARWLCERLGLPDRRVLFQIGGSFAVSTALALAQRARPGRIVAIHGGFHGLGVDSLAVTSVHKEFALQASSLQSRLAGDSVALIEPGDIPSEWHDISCVVYEPIQGANGYVPLDPDWLVALTDAAHANEVMTIADEIQCGYFRHGSLSPSRALGIEPTMLLYSKSMTNGLFPLSAVVYPADLERIVDTPVSLAHTFQTSALGFYAADAVRRFIESHPLESAMAQVEQALQETAEHLRDAPGIRAIHVTGPTLSFEVVGGDARSVVQRCLAERVLVFTGGPHGDRVRCAPPLTIASAQLQEALQVLLASVADVVPSRPNLRDLDGLDQGVDQR